MQVSGSLYSVLNYGTRSFENVYRNEKLMAVYETEKYDIDYKNNTMSAGFQLGLSWNWINKKRFTIRQRTAVAFDIYREHVTFILVDIGNGDSVSSGAYYGESVVNLGYQETAVASGIGFTASQELLYLRNKDSWSWGGGISVNTRQRNDVMFNRRVGGVYIPNARALGYGQYFTHQLGVVLHAEKQYERLLLFINLNQQVATLKKQKGAKYFTDGNELNPVSHNLDFRFPVLINAGVSFQFAKVKR